MGKIKDGSLYVFIAYLSAKKNKPNDRGTVIRYLIITAAEKILKTSLLSFAAEISRVLPEAKPKC